MTYLNIFLIAVICTFCLDVSGFVDEVTSMISGWMTKGVVKKPFQLKPFTCSLCSTFWISLIYVLYTGQFSLLVMTWICVCAWLTTIIPHFFYFLEAFVTELFNELNKHFNLN